jgi:hypothetical protein
MVQTLMLVKVSLAALVGGLPGLVLLGLLVLALLAWALG